MEFVYIVKYVDENGRDEYVVFYTVEDALDFATNALNVGDYELITRMMSKRHEV